MKKRFVVAKTHVRTELCAVWAVDRQDAINRVMAEYIEGKMPGSVTSNGVEFLSATDTTHWTGGDPK
jgi:hypothetical protein